MKMMKQREHALQHTSLVRRAYSQPCADRRAISHQVALRVVREFNLPDTTAEILVTTPLCYPEEPPLVVEARYHTPRTHRHTHAHSHSHVHTHVRRAMLEDRRSPSTPVSPTRSYSPVEVGANHKLCETVLLLPHIHKLVNKPVLCLIDLANSDFSIVSSSKWISYISI